jgi:hypothetical protein
VEWLKVKAISSNTSTTKKKVEEMTPYLLTYIFTGKQSAHMIPESRKPRLRWLSGRTTLAWPMHVSGFISSNQKPFLKRKNEKTQCFSKV